MPTIRRHVHGSTRGEYPVACSICGVPWPRKQLRLTAANLLVCPDEGAGLEALELGRLNAQGARSPLSHVNRSIGAPFDFGNDVNPHPDWVPGDANPDTVYNPDLPGIYVSNDGSDSGTGRSTTDPYLTIAKALSVIRFNETMFLRRGDTFREQIIGLPAGCEIRAYGPTSDPRPTVDARNVASNADFVAVGGATPNVYSIAWALNTDDAGGKCRHRAWEDDVMLVRASSLANCNATPGTFYSAPPTGGTDTVYVHPFGSTDPRTDGKEYQLTARKYGINAYENYLGARLYSLDSIGAAHADGSTCVDGWAYDCTARDGRIHNMFVRGMAVGCAGTGIDLTEDYAIFISYMDVDSPGATGRSCVFIDCVADSGTGAYTAFGAGYYVHTDGVRQWGTVQYQNCSAIGPDIAYSGIQATTFLYYGCGVELCKYGVAAIGNTRTVILGGEWMLANSVDNAVVTYTGNIAFDLILQGVKEYRVSGGEGPIRVANTLISATVRRCTFATNNANSPRLKSGSWTWRNNIDVNLIASNNGFGLGTGAGQVSGFDADFNCYYRPGDPGASAWSDLFLGNDYFAIANWRTFLNGAGLGAGKEAGSVQLDPQLADPANGDFSIGSATLRALGIGAEQNEENDAALQTLWNTYRIQAEDDVFR